MPEGVSRKQFIVICKAYRDMIVGSLEDIKTTAMMGAIQKHIPDFFQWLQDQAAFSRVGEVKLSEFSSTMISIGKLGEDSLNKMIIHLEKKEVAENEAKKREKEVSPDPVDNSNISTSGKDPE